MTVPWQGVPLQAKEVWGELSEIVTKGSFLERSNQFFRVEAPPPPPKKKASRKPCLIASKEAEKIYSYFSDPTLPVWRSSSAETSRQHQLGGVQNHDHQQPCHLSQVERRCIHVKKNLMCSFHITLGLTSLSGPFYILMLILPPSCWCEPDALIRQGKSIFHAARLGFSRSQTSVCKIEKSSLVLGKMGKSSMQFNMRNGGMQ